MASTIDLDALDPKERYKLLSAVVIPRPVAWVTTVSEDGLVNAAPYSFFNVFGQDPATIILGLERSKGTAKDTERNIEALGEYVVNIATPDLVDQMVGTASAYPSNVSEADALGLDLEPSTKVTPPRLAAAPVAIECVRVMALSLSAERSITIGRAVSMAARDNLVDMETLRVHWNGDYPVARLFADRYARLTEIERRAIPPVDSVEEPEP